MTTFAERFGQNVARLRDRAGITQEELGMRAELHRTAVGQIERGQRVARTDTLLKLAGSLDASTEEFFVGLRFESSVRTLGAMHIANGEEQSGP